MGSLNGLHAMLPRAIRALWPQVWPALLAVGLLVTSFAVAPEAAVLTALCCAAWGFWGERVGRRSQ